MRISVGETNRLSTTCVETQQVEGGIGIKYITHLMCDFSAPYDYKISPSLPNQECLLISKFNKTTEDYNT